MFFKRCFKWHIYVAQEGKEGMEKMSGTDAENKKLIVIIGPNGVGKSSTGKEFIRRYPNGAFVDSDWCRAINPFPFTEGTRKAVMENIFCLIRNYLQCEDIDYVIFTYGFHGERKAIFDEVLRGLEKENIKFGLYIIILRCSFEENVRRMELDGREENRIKRGMDNTFHFYDEYDDPIIDTTELKLGQVADSIAKLVDISDWRK